MQTLSVVHPPSADRRRGPRPARFGFRARLRRAASSLAWQTLTLFVVATLLPLSISFVHTDSGVRAQDVAGSALSLALVLLLWRRLATRLRALQAAAARWAQGDLAYRAKIGGADELGQLGATFDRMAGQIQETVQQNQVILREAQVQRDFALQVMNTMAQGLTVTDDRAHFEFVNPAYAQMLGYPPEALVGKSPLEVTSPDIHAVLLDARARRMVGETTRYETRLRRTDGSDVYALVTGAPRWRDGQVIGSISVITDLTERKRAEADLRRQYQEAESARSETRAVLDATNDAMCLFSPDRRLRMVNERFSELFGLAESDIVGRGFDDLQPEMERTLDDPAAFRALFDRAVAHPEQRLRQVIALRWPVPRELALYSTAVSGADGAYLGRLFVFRDVTREREVDRMKTEFVSLVSHELRTPLTSIKGYVDLLLDGEVGDVPEEQRDFLEIVRNNADRLAALINDLLDLSRIESGKVELKPSALDMARVIDGAVGALRPQIEAKGQRIGVTLAADLPPVWGDADRVNQILVNLLSNAYKYTPSGGEIAVVARIEGAELRVDVRDTGIGLSPEEQAQLFTKFFRAKNRTTQEVGGTGLGLAITRYLVEMHSGLIGVESAPGQGSTFSFTLPLVSTVAPHAPHPQPLSHQGRVERRSEERPLPLAPSWESGTGDQEASAAPPRRRILVVDDEPDIAGLIQRYLERGGYQTLVAHDGAEALYLARVTRPDLITLDIMLPQTDGLTVLEWLKSDPATAAVPVVLLSILPDSGDGRLLGAVDYVAKPVQEHVLLERVRRILDTLGGAAGGAGDEAVDRPRRVLLADDDPDVRELLAGHLRHAGYQVIEAADGAEVVQRARRERPELALIDVRMPGTDGIAALRGLRAEAETCTIPVVMMTASPGALAAHRSVIEALGGATLLSKPCTPEELTAALARGLRHLPAAASTAAPGHEDGPDEGHEGHEGGMDQEGRGDRMDRMDRLEGSPAT